MPPPCQATFLLQLRAAPTGVRSGTRTRFAEPCSYRPSRPKALPAADGTSRQPAKVITLMSLPCVPAALKNLSFKIFSFPLFFPLTSLTNLVRYVRQVVKVLRRGQRRAYAPLHDIVERRHRLKPHALGSMEPVRRVSCPSQSPHVVTSAACASSDPVTPRASTHVQLPFLATRHVPPQTVLFGPSAPPRHYTQQMDMPRFQAHLSALVPLLFVVPPKDMQYAFLVVLHA